MYNSTTNTSYKLYLYFCICTYENLGFYCFIFLFLLNCVGLFVFERVKNIYGGITPHCDILNEPTLGVKMYFPRKLADFLLSTRRSFSPSFSSRNQFWPHQNFQIQWTSDKSRPFWNQKWIIRGTFNSRQFWEMPENVRSKSDLLSNNWILNDWNYVIWSKIK